MKRRWLTPLTLGGLVVALIAGFLIWQVVIYTATYGALRAAPQGQATGPAKSDVIIVEFMDYRCPPCHALAPVMNAVAAAHPDVRIVYRPVPTHGRQSLTEALYALAAGRQGHFAEMHAALLAHENPVEPSELPGLCKQANVDCERLQTDMNDPALRTELHNTYRAASALGVKKVPTFLVNRALYFTDHGMPTAADLDRAIAKARS